MKMKQTLFMAIAITAIVTMGCAGQPEVRQERDARQRAIEAASPIRTYPAQRPVWVDSVPRSNEVLSFVGSAGRFATATGAGGARFFAEENGRTQLVDYFGTVMVNQARTAMATYGITSDVFAPQVVGQQLNERISQNVAQALAPREYYTLVFMDATNREAFEVFVLMEVSMELVRRTIDNFGREQADDYARRAAEEQDAARRQQMERAAEFFGGNLSGRLLGD